MSAVVGAAAAAVGAAALLGSASAAQRQAALTVPPRRSGDPRLVAALVGRPWWWIGTGASVVGLGLQVLALALGPIVLVQSVLTHSGAGMGPVLALGVGTGLGYGVTAVQLKAVGTQLATGLAVPLQHPALYTGLVVGPVAILLSQSALQQGRLATAVVSVILVVDPLVGLAAGLLWFGESVRTGATTPAWAGLLLCGVVLTQRGGTAPDDATTTPTRAGCRQT